MGALGFHLPNSPPGHNWYNLWLAVMRHVPGTADDLKKMNGVEIRIKINQRILYQFCFMATTVWWSIDFLLFVLKPANIGTQFSVQPCIVQETNCIAQRSLNNAWHWHVYWLSSLIRRMQYDTMCNGFSDIISKRYIMINKGIRPKIEPWATPFC